MNIIYTIKNSIYNPEFYKTARVTPAKKAVKYFFKIISLLSLLLALVLLPLLFGFFSKNTLDTIVNLYPSNLNIAVNNGEVTTNVQEPYAIKNTSTLIVGNVREKHQNILVIDTQTPFTPEQFSQYDTGILLKKNFIVTEDSQGKIQVTDLHNVKNFTLTQARLVSWENKILGYRSLFILLGFIGFFILNFILYCCYLIYLLFAALIIWLMAYIKKVKIGYGTSYKLGMYIIVPILILKLIFSLIHIPFFPFLFTFFVVVLALVNLQSDPIPQSDSSLLPVENNTVNQSQQ